MDVSFKYVKMCEKAMEIQKPWIRETGDYYIYKYGKDSKRKHSKVYVDPHIYFEQPQGTKQGIWLPRQDQLQKIVGAHNVKSLRAIFLVRNEDYSHLENYTSMEQLWLALIMEKLYKKRWTGEDWTLRK